MSLCCRAHACRVCVTRTCSSYQAIEMQINEFYIVEWVEETFSDAVRDFINYFALFVRKQGEFNCHRDKWLRGVELLPEELAWMKASLVHISITHAATMRFCYEIRWDYLLNNYTRNERLIFLRETRWRGRWVKTHSLLQWTCRESFFPRKK